MRRIALVVSLLGMAFAAQAAIIPIGQFTGTFSDSYETQPRFQFLPSYNIFGDGSSVQSLGAPNLHITTGWSFFGVTYPHSGEVFMGGAGVNYKFVFPTTAQRFGGFFTTNADAPDATATFYDKNNNILGTLGVSAPTGGQWAWNGWETTDVGIARIDIVARNQYGGFIDSDDITYTPVPEPAAVVLLGLALALVRRR